MKRGKETIGQSETPVLPSTVEEAAEWLEKEIGRIMQGEDRKDALFRFGIVETELGDVGKYITHDPIENPRARIHGTRQEEIHAYGQIFVQVIGLMWARNISFKEALLLGLQNWQERDWQRKEAESEKMVKGRVAYPGNISGEAYVVSEKHILKEFTRGVLVADILRPDHVMFLHQNRPQAIVTDQGGIVSHPAILAKELMIPAIVGTGNATIMIPHGSEIEVNADGKEGTVRVLHPR